MKPKVLILIALLAVVIAVIVSTYGDVSSTSTFEKADQQPSKDFHITGEIMKEMPIEYDPVVDPNYFTFFLKDKEGTIKKVVSHEPKLQDFELTETATIVGSSQGDTFLAKKVLPKCPSKYKDQQQAQES
ncbi:MAG: cytochrome c maturation protein CcmE [Bacteroidia bacterium]